MKQITIQGEQPFSPLAHSFGISASNEAYTLYYSSDGITYTAIDKETPSGENHFVVDCPKGVFFKCVGNNSKLTISY